MVLHYLLSSGKFNSKQSRIMALLNLPSGLITPSYPRHQQEFVVLGEASRGSE